MTASPKLSLNSSEPLAMQGASIDDNAGTVADQLRPRWPKLAALMDDSEHDVLAYMTFRTSTVPSCTARMKSTRMRSTSLWCWSERAHSGNTARRSNHLQQRACDTGRPMLEVEAPDRYPTFK